jgi:coronin-2
VSKCQINDVSAQSVMIFQEMICHSGSKASKVTFLGTSGRLLTTGFSRHSDRQYSIWDQNDLSKPLTTDTIDSSSGVVFPFYDIDTNIVFLAGKGDGNIRYYEITDEAPYIHFLSQFLSGNPQVSRFGKVAPAFRIRRIENTFDILDCSVF